LFFVIVLTTCQKAAIPVSESTSSEISSTTQESASSAGSESPSTTSVQETSETLATSDTVKPNWKTYTNEDYGFEIQYPEGLTIEETFTIYHHLSDTWRDGAAEDSGGKPILSIIVYRVENENTYPRYFGTELRIGASTGTNDVENCLNYDQYITSSSPTEKELINGITFNKLVIQDAATMQYVEGISYRTIYNDTCFAIEQLKTGSNYRDVPSPQDIPDSVLNSYYDSIIEIIKTFKFTR